MIVDVKRLRSRYRFPSSRKLGSETILAIGGDLEPDTLLYTYSRGIFPWYQELPIQWCSPPERMILQTGELHVSRSLRKFAKKSTFRVTQNQSFDAVISCCAKAHGSTWITPEMQHAYQTFHRMGFAHSWEIWNGEELAGGIYGVRLNRVFFAESMFHFQNHAGNMVFWAMMRDLEADGVILFDFQTPSNITTHFGARLVTRDFFLTLLSQALK